LFDKITQRRILILGNTHIFPSILVGNITVSNHVSKEVVEGTQDIIHPPCFGDGSGSFLEKPLMVILSWDLDSLVGGGTNFANEYFFEAISPQNQGDDHYHLKTRPSSQDYQPSKGLGFNIHKESQGPKVGGE
jgi:hypothetical protein